MKITIDTKRRITEQGVTMVWVLKDNGETHSQFKCSCLYEMLTAKELFDMLVNNEVIEIEPKRFYKYCNNY